jgi:outer membrane protein TolC
MKPLRGKSLPLKVAYCCLALMAANTWLKISAQTLPHNSAPEPPRITLREAIDRALAMNLNGQLVSAKVDEDAATRMRRYAALMLPRVNAQSYANSQNRDLSAFGISLPGMPTVVGPFANYDFRLYAQQNLFDRQSLHTLRSADHAVQADKLDLRDARDLIVRVTASLYLNAESAAARTEAAQTRVNDSNTLLQLAIDKHNAGTATGVDLLRAQVQLANDKQSLLVAKNQYKQTLLSLQRDMGMNPGEPLQLAESLRYQPIGSQQTDALIQSALTSRADFLSLASQRASLQEQQHANHARMLPKLSINGNFGAIGRSLPSLQPTGMIQGQLDFTVFDRDRQGEAAQLAASLRAIDDRVSDLRHGIEEDVREALLNLDSAAQQVEVATEGQQLARRELELSQDRFAQGTANNVEVVTAQDELARAQENYILAVTGHTDARFALARAIGDMEANLGKLMASNQQ